MFYDIISRQVKKQGIKGKNCSPEGSKPVQELYKIVKEENHGKQSKQGSCGSIGR